MNSAILLSICIPTYNRVAYLTDVLESVLPQLDSIPQGTIELLVSDNHSTDATAEYLAGVQSPHFRFWTNSENIGGDRNFLKCIREARGQYVWLVGDDDLVLPNSIQRILGELTKSTPGLLIADFGSNGKECVYSSYSQCLLAERYRNPPLALAHTLISANVFRRDLFDYQFAESKLYTSYAHMYGIMKGLGDSVVSIVPGLIAVRPVRPDFAKYPLFLGVKHATYLQWVNKRFHAPYLFWRGFWDVVRTPLEFGSRVKAWLVRHGLINVDLPH